MVAADIRAAVAEFEDVLVRDGLPLDHTILYGSQARREANEWSDIDLLVVLNLPKAAMTRALSRHVWGLSAQCDTRLEPVVCSVEELSDPDRPIVAMALVEGIDMRHPDNAVPATTQAA